MRELDRYVYTELSDNYVANIFNDLHNFIADFEKGYLVIRILDDAARLYVHVTSHQGNTRYYDTTTDLDTAKIFIQAYQSDPNQKIYKYFVEYKEDVARVYQYELGEEDTSISLQYINKNIIHENDPTIVLQKPVIAGPSVITPFETYNFLLSCRVLTKEDSLITTFIVECAGETKQIFTLPNARYVEAKYPLSIQVGEYKSGAVLELKVTAVDNEGHYSEPGIKYITVDAGKLAKPNILEPYNNSYIPPNNIYVLVSSFSVVKASNPKQVSIDWKITSDRKGEDIIYDGNFVGEADSFVLNLENDLQPDNYFLFVRYEDRYIGFSEWSLPVKVLVDTEYKFEQVIPPYVQSVLWLSRGQNFTLSAYYDTETEMRIRKLYREYTEDTNKIMSFNIHDYLTNTEVVLPSKLALNNGVIPSTSDRKDFECVDYTFTVPNDLEFYALHHKEYMISVKAINQDGFESFYNYAFIRVLDSAKVGKIEIPITEWKSTEMTDIIPSKYREYAFTGKILTPVNCSVEARNASIIVTPNCLPGARCNFTYVLSSEEGKDVYIFVEIFVKRMEEIQEYFFDTDSEITSFTGDRTRTFYSLERKKLLRYSSSWYELQETPQTIFGWPKLVFNPATKKRYFILKDTVRFASRSELHERYGM